MKQLVPASALSLSGAALTMTGVNVPLSQILLVSDATTGAVLYSMAGPAPASYSQGPNSTITLGTTPGASDKLTVYYDDGVAAANSPNVQLGSGTVSATTQRVTLATDGPEVTNSTATKNNTAGIGTTADTAATSDTGTFSLIALVKRLLGKLPALGSAAKAAAIPVTIATDDPSQVGVTYNYTNTSAITVNTVVLGPYDCSAFVEGSIHATAFGTGGLFRVQVSNDQNASSWESLITLTGQSGVSTNIAAVGLQKFPLMGAKYVRVIANQAFTGGTNTLVLSLVPKASGTQMVSWTGNPGVFCLPSANPGNGIGGTISVVSAASTNATSVKTTQGILGTILASNTSASFKYVKFFAKASAPTVGTDTPVLQVPIPPNATVDVSTSFAGFKLNPGIAFAITGGSALLDNTAVAAGDVLLNFTYA